MPLHHAMKLIEMAKEEETKEYFFRVWLVRYPNYTEKTYETFNQYLENSRPENVLLDNRSKEEIMKEIIELEQSFK